MSLIASKSAGRRCVACDTPCGIADQFSGECGAQLGEFEELREWATAAGGATDPRATRTWIRSRGPQFGVKEFVSTEDAASFVRGLRSMRDVGYLPPNKLGAIQFALRFEGPDNSWWAMGMGSVTWSRLIDGSWQPADAPPWLLLETICLVNRTEPQVNTVGPSSAVGSAPYREQVLL